MSYTHHKENVPLSILDGSDGELSIEFDYAPGFAADDDDPGAGECFTIMAASYRDVPGVPVGLSDHEQDEVVVWLDENWIRPERDPDEGRDND